MKKVCRYFLFTLVSVFTLSSALYGADIPRYGGKLTVVVTDEPRVMGWIPKMDPTDISLVFPAIESLLALSADRTWAPELAESYKVEPEKKKISFTIRKGVVFHDGSYLTPEVVKWNYDINITGNKLQYADQIESVVVEGEKVVLNLKSFQPLMIGAYGRLIIVSKQSYEVHGEEWMMTHVVGTGPFKEVSWIQGVHSKWERFDGYWREGRPYLDTVEYIYAPDAATSLWLMLSNLGDIWLDVPAANQKEALDLGLSRKASWPGFTSVIYFNNTVETAPTYKKGVREAIEFAIDKNALTKATGYGFAKPIGLFHPEGEWAHDPGYEARRYNPEKAKQLLRTAGYDGDLSLELLVSRDELIIGKAIKAFLGDIGVNVHLDIIDPDRFRVRFSSMGWKDMCLGYASVDTNSLESFHAWFGHNPSTKIASFNRPEELLKMSRDSLTLLHEASQKKMVRRMARFMADEALFLSLSFTPIAAVTQPGVHTNYMDNGVNRWQLADTWKE